MEKRIIITKRFHKNTLHIYKYLLKEFSGHVSGRSRYLVVRPHATFSGRCPSLLAGCPHLPDT